MKRYRSADGEERLWFEDDEIERIMEDELRSAQLLPTREVEEIVDYGVGGGLRFAHLGEPESGA